MRPTVYLRSGAAAALALSTYATAGQAQETRRIEIAPSTARVYTTRADDRDRAVLGVSLATGGMRDTAGVRITDVTENGPAAKAGIEEGDRITAIDGTSLKVDAADAEDFGDLGYRRLQRALGKHKPGDEVSLTLQRGRESRTVKVKTVAAADLNDRAFAVAGMPFERSFGSMRESIDSMRARAERRPALGLSIGATGNKRDTLGLFVSGVADGGPAEKAGIVEGARIASIDGVDLAVSRADAEDPEIASAYARRFTRAVEKHKPGETVSLKVWQNGAYRTTSVTVGKASDVWKDRNGFSFSFGDGDGVFVMPPGGAITAPIAPRTPLLPSMPLRGTTIRTPGVRSVTLSAPRAVAAPRTARRVVRM